MSEPKKLLAGWKGLANASKWHYFDVAGRSLCGRWLTMSRAGLETGNDDSPDNCLVCRRKLAKLKATPVRKGRFAGPILDVDEILAVKK